jgi:hypothetical protein
VSLSWKYRSSTLTRHTLAHIAYPPWIATRKSLSVVLFVKIAVDVNIFDDRLIFSWKFGIFNLTFRNPVDFFSWEPQGWKCSIGCCQNAS